MSARPYSRVSLASTVGAFLLVASGFISPAGAADGFANVNGVTTGGFGGPTVTVTTAAQFISFATQATAPYVIEVSGTINLGTATVHVGSNKTITGLGTTAKLIGELGVTGKSNVIFQNLTVSNNILAGTGDAIRIYGAAHHVWVDHCTFVDAGDGSLDVTQAADYVTVSWCKFYYTVNSGHNFVNLIGASDSDTGDRGKLHVTFHHNWWSTLCIERMPRVRFGQVHIYNNYYSATGNNYCLRAALESQNLLENNYFDGVNKAWQYYTQSGQVPGLIRAVGNTFVNTAVPAGGNDAVFTPPYSYTLDASATVKSSVMAGAGAGSGPPPSPDYTLAISPSSATAEQGASASYTLNINRVGGFADAVSLSISGLPAGSSGTFNPNPASGASSALTVTTSTTTPSGSYSFTVTGVGGGVTRTANATLVVQAPAPPGFTLSATPASQTITQGQSTTYAVTISRTGGFSGAVTLSVSGLGSGATGTFSPNPATGTSSTLTITTTASAATGSPVLTITGTSGSLTRTTTVTLVVNPSTGCTGECS